MSVIFFSCVTYNNKLTTNQQQMAKLAHKSVHVLHLLLIGPFLAYVGLYGKKCSGLCFNVMTFLGFFVMVYHAYRLYHEMNKDITINTVGSAIKNTINNVGGQFIGKDNAGNNVVSDEDGNVTVVSDEGEVVHQNNNKALESANQAINNSQNNVSELVSESANNVVNSVGDVTGTMANALANHPLVSSN